jgi:hypothetical protein
MFTEKHSRVAAPKKSCACKHEKPKAFAGIQNAIGMCLVCKLPLPEVTDTVR